MVQAEGSTSPLSGACTLAPNVSGGGGVDKTGSSGRESKVFIESAISCVSWSCCVSLSFLQLSSFASSVLILAFNCRFFSDDWTVALVVVVAAKEEGRETRGVREEAGGGGAAEAAEAAEADFLRAI